METDYAKIQEAALNEDWTKLAGRSGQHLTLNTSDRKTAGKVQSEKRRAWWLTKEVTREVCKQNLWPREAIEIRRDERA
jgi:hypothetical protein